MVVDCAGVVCVVYMRAISMGFVCDVSMGNLHRLWVLLVLRFFV